MSMKSKGLSCKYPSQVTQVTYLDTYWESIILPERVSIFFWHYMSYWSITSKLLKNFQCNSIFSNGEGEGMIRISIGLLCLELISLSNAKNVSFFNCLSRKKCCLVLFTSPYFGSAPTHAMNKSMIKERVVQCRMYFCVHHYIPP